MSMSVSLILGKTEKGSWVSQEIKPLFYYYYYYYFDPCLQEKMAEINWDVIRKAHESENLYSSLLLLLRPV